MLKFRSECIHQTRTFFRNKHYLETDTPALAPYLIPETCLEVFTTDYQKSGEAIIQPLYLVPSPEVYIKQLIADHGVSIFQISKCYRNGESVGRIHSPEFTMLEYYTMGADYRQSLELTESFINTLIQSIAQAIPLHLPFERITMDEAFMQGAGFSLASATESRDLALHAERLGLGDSNDYQGWAWDDLYELLLVHAVEPFLANKEAVFVTDYPARVPTLAQERTVSQASIQWQVKERWELYIRGVEIANCYTEERNKERVDAYIREEGAEKNRSAVTPHPVIDGFGHICARMPPCSGVAVGLDRLIMVLAGKKSIDTVLPFPLY